MNDFPPIGSRVRYTGGWWALEGVTGIVTKHYPWYDDSLNRAKDPEMDCVCVEVDDWGPHFQYSSGKFAPPLSEVEQIQKMTSEEG